MSVIFSFIGTGNMGGALARAAAQSAHDVYLSDKDAAKVKALAAEIVVNEKYVAFTNAQQALNALMAEVNAEIKFCITGERPSTCTHDCSTCGGCSH